MNLAGMQRTEGAQKGLLDGLWCYAAGTSETFRTVSEWEFYEVRKGICDGELGRPRLFHERLQIPHEVLGALPVHRVAGLGVDLQRGTRDRCREPL